MQYPIRIVFYAPSTGVIDRHHVLTWDESAEARLCDTARLRFSIGYSNLPELLSHYIAGTITWLDAPPP